MLAAHIPTSFSTHPHAARYQGLLFGFLLALCCLFSPPALSETAPNPLEQETTERLSQGSQLLQAGKHRKAIGYFDQVIARYEAAYPGGKTRFYGARTQAESLFYLLQAASAKQDARIVSVNWPYAHYLKAYALVDLGEEQQAQTALKKALELSPSNAQFLNELGHLQQKEKNWALSLKTFELAEKATEFSPPDLKEAEITRAWRGEGYSYIEQRELQKAKEAYQRALELNKDDAKAKQELRYIDTLEQKQ